MPKLPTRRWTWRVTNNPCEEQSKRSATPLWLGYRPTFLDVPGRLKAPSPPALTPLLPLVMHGVITNGALAKMGNMGSMGSMGNMSVWRPGCCIILVVLYSGAPPQAALAMGRAGTGSFRIENGKWQMANGKSATDFPGVRA